jgi:hypothetical protein
MKPNKTTILCLLSLLYGCAFLGSKAHVYNCGSLIKIQNAAIITIADEQGIPAENDSLLDLTFKNEIKEKLTQKQLFYFEFYNEIDSLNAEKVKKYDALIIFKRKLIWPIGPYSDSKVEISIYDTKSNTLIMYVSHNTDLGNSYWKNPKLPGTLIDATNGAINKLNVKLNKLK